jgi:putative ABC transport system permease protein
MFQNYLRSALRNFFRQKGFTTLNIIGLAIGMAASFLIYQYVWDEFSYDKFHKDAEHIYRVQYDSYHEGRKEFSSATAFPGVGPAIKETFPEVEAFGRMMLRYSGGVVRYEDRSFQEEYIFMVEQSLIELFSYEIVAGRAELDRPNTALIAEDMVSKYFGLEDPIGKEIRFRNEERYEITGVIRSPENSHIKFHFLFSYPTMEQWGDWTKEAIYTNWGWYDFYNYVKLRPGADIAAMEARFPDMIDNYYKENASEEVKLSLQPLLDIHLYSDLLQEARVNGNGRTVYVLLIVALFILLIAWINYINLATARAMERAREVGIRKVVGALRSQLIRQFIFESVLLNAVAAVLAIVFIRLATPSFNQLTGKTLSLDLLYHPAFWLAAAGVFLLGAVLSGLYPAFVLSSYRPVTVLKGVFKNSGEGIWLRRGLVGLQFFASIFLIAGTMIIYRQLSFMRNRDLGIDIDQILVVAGPGVVESDSVYTQKFNGFKTALEQYAAVKNTAASSEIPGNLIYWTNSARRLGVVSNDGGAIMYRVGVGYDYMETMGHQLVAGRNFDESFGSDNEKVVINETAVNTLGFAGPEEALHQKFRIGGDTVEIIGIMADYHQEGLKKNYDPITFNLAPNARRYYSIKMNTGDLSNTIAAIRREYRQWFPGNPFEYYFLDDFFNRQYLADQRFGKTLGIFAFLAIFVACLGLLGLSAFSATQRRKEISIRKVLGASTGNVLVLLSREYAWLVLVAAALAGGAVYLAMNRWLESFAFRIDIPWWVFLAAASITFSIALLTVSWQSLQVARANPAKHLRTE